ncbi:MAG: cell division protein FtsA [Salinivirgaceae bacterium]|nr:cell division protein FtsA [Salinivirgaceae bacterium]
MNPKEKIVAAIDIGTTKIVAIIGKMNETGKIDILGYGNTRSTGVKRGVVLNIEQTVNAIRQAVEVAESQAGLKITDAYVGIAGQHIRSMRNRGYINRDSYDEEISKGDVQALIDDMYKIPIDVGEEIIHVLPQSFIVDNETGVKNPVGMFGKRLEANFHIVIGQTAAANNIKKCVNRAGINVKRLVLEPLASSDAVLTEDEKEIGVALVDIGGGTTDVAVFYDGIIRHTAVIPFGGNIVTQDIKQGCNILERYAEQLKVKYGSSLADKAQENKVVSIPGINGRPPKEISFKNLAYIIQSRMEEIIAQVYFEIEASGMLQYLGAGIVITGGGALLKNLSQLVAFKSGMDVRLGLPNQSVKSEIVEEVNQPNYATSIGLVLTGFNDNDGCCAKPVQRKAPEPKAQMNEELSEKEIPKREKEEAKKVGKKKIATLFDKLGDFFEVDDEQM